MLSSKVVSSSNVHAVSSSIKRRWFSFFSIMVCDVRDVTVCVPFVCVPVFDPNSEPVPKGPNSLYSFLWVNEDETFVGSGPFDDPSCEAY
jgi:hypothetical protein